jgi:hypothetical protein
MLQKACRATRMKLPEMAAKVVETKEVPVTPSVKRRLSSARRGKA